VALWFEPQRPPNDVELVFKISKLDLVTISSGPDGTAVFQDGRLAEHIPSFKFSRNELSGEVIIGASPVTFHPWNGELSGLAVYSRADTD